MDKDNNVSDHFLTIAENDSVGTGENYFNTLCKVMTEYGVEWNKLKGISMDGAVSLFGKTISLKGRVVKECQKNGWLIPEFVHFRIHMNN